MFKHCILPIKYFQTNFPQGYPHSSLGLGNQQSWTSDRIQFNY